MRPIDKLLSTIVPGSRSLGLDDEVAAVVSEAFDARDCITPKEARARFLALIDDLYENELDPEHKEGLPEAGPVMKIGRMRSRTISPDEAMRLEELELTFDRDAKRGNWDNTRVYLMTRRP